MTGVPSWGSESYVDYDAQITDLATEIAILQHRLILPPLQTSTFERFKLHARLAHLKRRMDRLHTLRFKASVPPPL